MAEQHSAVREEAQGGGEHHHDGGCDIPTFQTRDLLVREDIMAKAKELANLIYTSDEVQHFRRAENQIQGNQRIQQLMNQIKKKQKEVVAFEQTFKNPGMVQKIEGEMEALQDELDAIPIVSEFQQSQADINYLLQMVVSVISDTVSEKLTLEAVKPEAPESCE